MIRWLARAVPAAFILVQSCTAHSDRGTAAAAASSTPQAVSAPRTLPDLPPRTVGPPLQLGEGTFALTDAAGSLLIGLDTLAEPAAARSAVCSGASVVPVTFLRYQPGQEDSAHGRVTAETFTFLRGPLYRVAGESPPGNATCYLSSDSALLASAVPVQSAMSLRCDSALVRLAAAAKARAVEKCWPFGSSGPNVSIAAIQFATRDTEALASLAVIDHGQILFEDYPARYTGPDEDLWRVGDGGAFSVEGIQVLFLARVRGTDLMALTWAGEEGEDADLLAADSSSAFRRIVRVYRYWVPQ